jgi:prepilin peptidase CpaA
MLGVGHPLWVVRSALLLALCVACSVTDLRSRKIPDLLTLPAMVVALVLGFVTGGLSGVLASATSLIVCGTVLGVVALAGGMGGGDVKMMAAVGALLGLPDCLWGLLYAALFGGLLAFGMALFRGQLWRALRNIGAWALGLLHLSKERPPLGQGSPLWVPYGLAIAAGAIWAEAGRYWPVLRVP